MADGETEPIKYWLSTLSENIAFRQLVDIANADRTRLSGTQAGGRAGTF
jgi:hypothetical protein